VSTAIAAVPVVLGTDTTGRQHGIVGRSEGRTVAVDLDGCHTIGVFGVQGSGKSYTVGAIAEMAVMPASSISNVRCPLSTVYFHYHRSDSCPPEHVAAIEANDVAEDLTVLARSFAAKASPLRDVVVLSPAGKVEQRRRELRGMQVAPLLFGPTELGADDWRDLLCASNSDALYVRQMLALLRRERDHLRVSDLRDAVARGTLSPPAMRLAQDRLELAAEYVQDGANIGAILRPGRTVIVDLRDEWIEKDDALALFLTLMRVFTRRGDQARFNKLIVFDEAHKYMSDGALTTTLVETAREMRHLGASIVIASQDPMSVPQSVLELSSIVMLHRMTSPRWLKHLQGALVATKTVSIADLAGLAPGEAMVWAQQCTEAQFRRGMRRVRMRPRLSKHGGETVRASQG
jgi:ABC-type dipeptide/oligopeptide/nickel transport system ATPase component